MYPIAAIIYERGFDIDELLFGVAMALSKRGTHIGGMLQRASKDGGSACAQTIHVVDLLTNQSINIWEDRGACASGCRLDEHALAMVEPALDAAIAEPVDLLIINRFGRAESLGRGLRRQCERAFAAGVPVLTAVRAPYVEAWSEFHAGSGRTLPPEKSDVLRWFEGVGVGTSAKDDLVVSVFC